MFLNVSVKPFRYKLSPTSERCTVIVGVNAFQHRFQTGPGGSVGSLFLLGTKTGLERVLVQDFCTGPGVCETPRRVPVCSAGARMSGLEKVGGEEEEAVKRRPLIVFGGPRRSSPGPGEKRLRGEQGKEVQLHPFIPTSSSSSGFSPLIRCLFCNISTSSLFVLQSSHFLTR